MPKSKIEEKISQKIKKDQIKMKPKYYFVLGTVSIALGMALSFVFSGFFVNLISNRIRVYKMADYLPMGGPGRVMFLRHFPWYFLILTIIMFTIGAWLLKRYDVSYKKSFLAILTGIIITTICAGLIVDKAGINKPLQKYPKFRKLYDTNLKDKKWTSGTIVSINDDLYIIEISNGNEVEVKINEKTWVPPRKFSVGECVRVVGDLKEDIIDAFGITPCKPGNPTIMGKGSPERKTPPKMYYQ